MPAPNSNPPPISFLAFFLLWAQRMGWDVPPLHVRVCQWLQWVWAHGGDVWLLMLPRGHAKSTILEIFNAWVLYCQPLLRILHQSEADGTALKTSRGTQNVLRHHPLTRDLYVDTGKIEQWWLNEAAQAHDPRNASMYAKGILSNVTSSRADFVQNDDIEVPKNIGTAEAREKLRFRLGEQVHIAVPGAPTLYVGTPHAHDSIYDDVKALGADALVVRMFEFEHRIEKADKQRYTLPFVPEFIFSGIYTTARLLRLNVDYRMEGTVLVLANPGGELLDCYAGSAWPERFDAEEMLKRRRKTRTLGEWDSQYQLHAKPVKDTRLDPARIVPYAVEPVLRFANGASSLWLGTRQLVAVSARWDPSGGKIHSDASSLGLVFHDTDGRRYLHRVDVARGEVAEFGEDGKTIIGGQVMKVCDLVAAFNVPRLVIETNGIGGFAPAVLRAALRQRRLRCAVVGATSSGNKNKRILDAWENLLLSRGMIWAHVSVLEGPLWEQMREWNPLTQNQADDYLDVTAAAISDTPERVSAKGGIPQPAEPEDWRPTGGAALEVEFER